MALMYSIIVPAYNEEDFLPATLERLQSIMAKLPVSGEIIVTDNNSTDRTAEIAREHGARVVFEEHQQISRSRNAGGRASEAAYLFFVDADTLITDELFAESLQLLDTGRVCGGGAIAGFDGGLKSGPAKLFLRLWNWLSRSLRWACGAYVFCRREAFVDVGGFSEKVYASEEIFFSSAVKKWGKPRGQTFEIVQTPIETSSRKLDWFGTLGLLLQMGVIIFCPFLLFTRWGCRSWYRHPPSGKGSDQ